MKIRRGIYAILNFKEDIKYIGSSINIYNRIFDHKNKLKDNSHYNQQLQDDYNRLGKEWFKYVLVEEIDTLDRELLYKKEREYIIELRKETRLYNLAIPNNEGGSSHADITIEKLREISNTYIKENPELIKEQREKAKINQRKWNEENPERLKEIREKQKEGGIILGQKRAKKIVAENSEVCHILDSARGAARELNLNYNKIHTVLKGRISIGNRQYKKVFSCKGWKFYYYEDRFSKIISKKSSIGFENFS